MAGGQGGLAVVSAENIEYKAGSRCLVDEATLARTVSPVATLPYLAVVLVEIKPPIPTNERAIHTGCDR